MTIFLNFLIYISQVHYSNYDPSNSPDVSSSYFRQKTAPRHNASQLPPKKKADTHQKEMIIGINKKNK